MTNNQTIPERTSPVRALILLAAAYIVGNLCVAIIFYYYANINLDQALLRVPGLFIAVPIIGFLIAIIGDLFKTTGRLKLATFGILGLYVITWLFITIAWINILTDGLFWDG